MRTADSSSSPATSSNVAFTSRVVLDRLRLMSSMRRTKYPRTARAINITMPTFAAEVMGWAPSVGGWRLAVGGETQVVLPPTANRQPSTSQRIDSRSSQHLKQRSKGQSHDVRVAAVNGVDEHG